jgi:hypothetical protein
VPKETVAGRYRVLRELGRGGMATVYLAVDEKHQRDVALKAMHPALAAAVGTDRFLQEIEITAGLNHPHILPLLDSGTDEGLLYYVMPYVTGGSLRLLMGSPIPLEAITRITREVASALDYAHARSVVHRDVKPENILFNEGLAVVSDFGIARAVSGVDTRRMTGTGLSVGTLGYMSPEQALGAETLDERTDVYSLGCVAYEMLVGCTPAAWPGAEDVGLGRFADLPEEHRRQLDRLPGRLEQVLVRALALRAQHRFPAAGELAAALAAASERTARFSDQQVRQLLKRAAELQAQAQEPGDLDLTMGGVEQIAAQVGIPPEHVREAAREIAAEPGPESSAGPPETRPPRTPDLGRLGGDWRRLREEWNRLVAHEVVEGKVPETAFPLMVAEIQRSLGTVGHTSIVGDSLTWSPVAQDEDTRKVIIQVTAETGATRIRIQEELGISGVRKLALAMGGVFGATFGGALAQAFAMGEPGAPLTVLAFAGMGVLVAIRSVVAVDANERAPALDELAKTLAELGRSALAAGDS